jgi:hypothetical protein
MSKLIMTISIFIISSVVVAADVYMWTDANGVKRFSNAAAPADAKALGKEANYVAPAPTNQPSKSSDFDESKLTRSERFMLMETERPPQQLIIDRQKTDKPIKESTPYKIDWSRPRVSGNELSISGTVSYGESCKTLTVTAYLYDEKGNETLIRCQASDVGGSGSRILSGTIRKKSYYGSDWRIRSDSTSCN